MREEVATLKKKNERIQKEKERIQKEKERIQKEKEGIKKVLHGVLAGVIQEKMEEETDDCYN